MSPTLKEKIVLSTHKCLNKTLHFRSQPGYKIRTHHSSEDLSKQTTMAASSLAFQNGPLFSSLRVSPSPVPKSFKRTFSSCLPIRRFPKPPTPTPFPNPRPPSTSLHKFALRNRAFHSRARVSSSENAQPFSPGDDRGALAPMPSFIEFLTSERVKVVIMIGLALVLCSTDRVVMSVAIVPLSLSHGWTRSFAGVVQSSFLWGYLISPIAGGALVDYYGGKTVMAWGVALWSLATFLTPWAAESSLWALLAVRAMVGVAEGVALPCMNSVISRWFPRVERTRAVGIAMAGFTLGNAVGLVLSPILMQQGGIFGPFVIFGLSGFLWVLVWLSATSSSPERSPQISKFELNYILGERAQTIRSSVDNKAMPKVIPPFKLLLSKLPTWTLMVANAMHSWGFFVILSWMPIYFNSVFHVELRHAAWFSAVPWSLMAVIGYFAGAWSDFLIQSGTGITATRKIMQSIGFIGPSIALLGLTSAKSPSIASAWLTLAVGLKSFSHSGFLVNIQEIAPQYTGVLNGFATTAGTFAAILGTVGAGYFVELVGSFQGFLWFTSLLYLFAALFWVLFSTAERVDLNETD